MRFDGPRTDAPPATLGETGGDVLSMTLELGYAISALIFLGFFMLILAPTGKIEPTRSNARKIYLGGARSCMSNPADEATAWVTPG